ncbi:MAG: hypothetical protein ACKO9S_09515 [Bacteroidota bacterium]
MRGIQDEIRTQATLDEGKQMVEDVKKEVRESIRMEPYDGAIDRDKPKEKEEEKPQG